MKLSIILVMLLGPVLGIFTDSDHIILRNGQEYDVKLLQITDEKVVYSNAGDKTGRQHEVASKDVYMVYVEKQGNIYFTPEGKRVTGESKRVDPKKNDVIYLVTGAEIAADAVSVTTESVRYSVKVKNSGVSGLVGKGSVSEKTLRKGEVFMIRYRNGMRDIITPLEAPKKVEKKDSVKVEGKPQFVVVFHSVVKGETLESVAQRYNVTVEQIVEWNELSSSIKPDSPLAPDMQLMIYQPKRN